MNNHLMQAYLKDLADYEARKDLPEHAGWCGRFADREARLIEDGVIPQPE